ncbi:MAG: hypothetical protein JW837_06210 [Sedimentisphaerales bacterium]|nr:hypothetical protein [Sedimentisphaerales bacterium]
MDWCAAERYEAANHNPIAVFNNDRSKAVVTLTVKPEETVRLGADGTYDPDGDKVSYRWFVYNEAGNYKGSVNIKNDTAQKAYLIAPKVKSPYTIHAILEVKDNGKPSLFSYRRIIIDVKP